MGCIFRGVSVLIAIIIGCAECYRILGVFPHPGKSHFDVFKPVLKELSVRGHSVTVISHFPLEKEQRNYIDVSLKGTVDLLIDVIPLTAFHGWKIERHAEVTHINHFGRLSCEAGLKSKALQNFLKKEEKYDLILIEMFNTHCFGGLIKKFGAPFIGVKSHALMPWSNQWFGNPSNPSYIPVIFSDFSDQMSFLQRVENTVMLVFNTLYYNLIITPESSAFSKKYLGDKLSISDRIMYNASLVLVNSHYSFNRPKPLVPNVIEVGGIHVGKQGQLPTVGTFQNRN